MRQGKKHFGHKFFAVVLVAIVFGASAACAHTTSVDQERLTDSVNPAAGNYDLQFARFDRVLFNASGELALYRERLPASLPVPAVI